VNDRRLAIPSRSNEFELADARSAAQTLGKALERGAPSVRRGLPDSDGGSWRSVATRRNVMCAPGFENRRKFYNIPKGPGKVGCDGHSIRKGESNASGTKGHIRVLFRLNLRDSRSPLVEKVSVGNLADLSGAQGWCGPFFDSCVPPKTVATCKR